MFIAVSTLSLTSHVTPSCSSLGIPFNVTLSFITSSSKIIIPSVSSTKIVYASILRHACYTPLLSIRPNFVTLTTLGVLYTINDEGPYYVIFSIVVLLPPS